MATNGEEIARKRWDYLSGGNDVALRRGPVSTYRVQLTADFGFAAAGEQAEYLARLGVSHVYLSPVLEAAPGSAHGYDVIDHSRISQALGGESGFREMAARFAAHGLGIVLDIVPNHMAVPAPERLNAQLWEVLRDGPRSRYAHWFDIDWEAGGGAMLLPVLAGPLEDCMSDIVVSSSGLHRGVRGVVPPGDSCLPDLSVDAGQRILRYFDHEFPLRPGTEDLPLPELLAAQHYRLGWWREITARLNWRRFFDISSLIGIRVEDPDVFVATHEVLLRLADEGLIDGFRIDHPDGLADPRGYLRRLAASASGAWIVVEKILEPDERLPADWPCAGTTGYDALRVVDGLFLDPAGGEALTWEYVRFSGQVAVPAGFAEVAHAAKREVASEILTAEVGRLARLLRAALPEAGAPEAGALETRAPDAETDPGDGENDGDLRTVLIEVLAEFRVYRAYVRPEDPPSRAAVEAVRGAVARARRRLPERLWPLAESVGDLALGSTEFAVRFGQTTGPVLAKGIEDTASYRWPRLVSRNEVGGDPDRFAVSVSEFNEFAARLATGWPASMTTLSTHDTKRQEDVRARLAVLAEMPGDWGRRAAEWQYRAERLLPEAAGLAPETAYLLWQTLAGAWPLTGQRLEGYLTKAMREAKIHTSWLSPDAGYEKTALRTAGLALTDDGLRGSIGDFVASIAADAAVNSLGAKLVQLTMPGVPDMYQGCELAALSLVDPDNRRPVDFARRRELLETLDNHDNLFIRTNEPDSPGPQPDPGSSDLAPEPGDIESLTPGWLDGAKLLVTSRALRLRRQHPEWFADRYAPLAASGEASRHAVAFARFGGSAGGGAITVVTRLPRGLRRRGGWADTMLPLPGPGWRDVFTGQVFGGRPPLSALLDRFPVALLVPEDLLTPEEQ
ncbi:MAG: malto-oligosyltrehalose synthase [Nocardiopsaceae bacterium]|nr:malto-oligosyltrehalose synthase [Nocardiopsaceae bacterium]